MKIGHSKPSLNKNKSKSTSNILNASGKSGEQNKKEEINYKEINDDARTIQNGKGMKRLTLFQNDILNKNDIDIVS